MSLPPPHDRVAEEAIVTSCVLRPEVFPTVSALVRAEDFFIGSNRAIFDALSALSESGKPIDTVTLSSQLSAAGKLPMVGGNGAILELMGRTPAIGNPEEYARTVRSLSTRRTLATTCERIAAECYSDMPTADLVSKAEHEILAIGESAGSSDGDTMKDAGRALFRRLESEQEGISTGFADLDEITAGYRGGQLIYVAARPGMGKTAFAFESASRVAAQGAGVLFVSLETPAEDLFARAVSARARVPFQDIRRRRLTKEQWSRLTHETSALAELPIRILGAPAGLQTIFAQARRCAADTRRAKLGLVVVDHVGLVSPNTKAAARNREQEIAGISRGLKSLAMMLNVPVIGLVQVGRDVDKEARVPRLSDLRESGSLEQDCDVCMAVHRPAYFDRHAPPELRREAELHILKQRSGPLGVVSLDWDERYAAFSDGHTYGDRS